MCVPLAAAAAIASLAAAGISAVGMIQQGNQSKALGEYNAKVAENTAQQQQWAAEDAAARGQIAEDQQRTRTRQILGAQRAAFGAAGSDLTDQSTVNVLSDTARAGELDALTIRSNAAREAWGFQNAATDSLSQAAASRFQGRAAQQAGWLSAGGTLLSGASNSYTQYRNLRVR